MGPERTEGDDNGLILPRLGVMNCRNEYLLSEYTILSYSLPC